MENDTNTPSFSLIEGSEREQMIALRNRLFVPCPHEELWSYSKQETPFVDSTWKKTLVPDSFRFAMDDDAGREGLPMSSKNGWPQRNGMRDTDTYMDPLIWCLESRDDEDVIITNDWGSDSHACGYVDTATALYFRSASNIVSMQAACDACAEGFWSRFMVFGSSGDWASCDYFDDDHLIGGTPKFIEHYYAAAGGEEYVRAWYYQYNLTDVLSGPGEHGSREDYYGHTDWPLPVYPEDEYYKWGEDIDWAPMFGDRIKSCGPGMTEAEEATHSKAWSAAYDKRKQADQSGDD